MFAVISKKTYEVWGLGLDVKSAINHAKEVTFSSIHPATKNPNLFEVSKIKNTGQAYDEVRSKGVEILFSHIFRVENNTLIKGEPNE